MFVSGVISLKYGVKTDRGLKRQLNEDNCNVLVGYPGVPTCFVIADGMGGHNAGEVASKLAVEKTIEYIKYYFDLSERENLIREAIKISNKHIFDLAQQDSSLKGMGTTLTACLVYDKEMLVANVGDSGCYVLKQDGLKKITKDHSLVQQLIDIGSITEEEALRHPNKNIITRALGTEEDVEVDIFKIDLRGIEKVILCTDGLTNMINRDEMQDILLNNNNEDACKKMVELSKLKGGRDNISVIVFEGECENDRNFTR